MIAQQEVQIFSGPFFVIGYENSGKQQLIGALSSTHQLIATDKRYPVEITSSLQITSSEQLPANPFGIVLVYNITDMNSFLYIQQIMPSLPEAPVTFLIGTHRDQSHARQVSFEMAQRYKKDNALLWFEVSSLEEKEIDILRKQIFIRSVFAVRNLVEVDAAIPVKTPEESVAFLELCLVRESQDGPDVNVQNINQGSLLVAPQNQQVVPPPSQLIDSIPDFQQYDAHIERAQNLVRQANQLEEDTEEYYYDEESQEQTEKTATTQRTQKSVQQIIISPKQKQRSIIQKSMNSARDQAVVQEADDQQARQAAQTMQSIDFFPISAHLPSPLKSRGSRLHPQDQSQEVERSRFQSQISGQAMSKSKLQPTYRPSMQKSYIPVKASQDTVNRFQSKTTTDPSTANGYWEQSLCPSRTRNEIDVSRIPHAPQEALGETKFPHGNSRYGEVLMNTKYQKMQQRAQGKSGNAAKSEIFAQHALEIDLEIGGKTFLLAVNRDDNAYEIARQFCEDNALDAHYIKKLALLILDRMQKLTMEEKNMQLQKKRERYETYRFQEPTFRNLVMRKILFKFELTVAGRSITVAWREGDVERIIAQHILKTLSLREEEYLGFVLSKINEIVSLWKLNQHDAELQEVY